MEYLYDRIEALCASRKVNITQMCKDAGVPRSALSDFKAGRIKSISADKLAKIADYFKISADFLLDRPPFDCWEMINANRKGFLSYVDISADTLKVIWGIDSQKPDETPLSAFILFVSHTITSAHPTEDGDWEIELRPSYQKEKSPAKAEAEEDPLSQVSFALFGTHDKIDEGILDDVRAYARFKLEQQRKAAEEKK